MDNNMIKNDISAFSIPIRYGILDVGDLNKKLIEDIFFELNTEGNQERSGVGVQQTISGLEKKYKSFDIISNKIKQFLLDFMKYVKVYDEFDVRGLWANVNNDPFAFHMPHSHGINNSCIFTGIYFPTSGYFDNNVLEEYNKSVTPIITSKTQPNPGDLVLLDPNENIKTSISTQKTEKYPFFGNPICITPIKNSIIVFPSYLNHMVTPTKKENFTRISIAYNVGIL
jgi:hypothetical protein|tara:strand:+ start:8172 stop:8852 length:681 start_codon:yes stop_codon:yes gene_type:complete